MHYLPEEVHIKVSDGICSVSEVTFDTVFLEEIGFFIFIFKTFNYFQ